MLFITYNKYQFNELLHQLKRACLPNTLKANLIPQKVNQISI